MSPKAMTLTAVANEIMERLPGWRAEVIHGQLLISPLRDASHACALTNLLVRFAAGGLHGTDTDVLQNVGLWLPTGAEDYAIPDLVIVDADIDDHLVENNCYAPACFRLVLEVTSSYRTTDLLIKVSAYAAATIPVYVIVDREQRRLHVLTAPVGDEYTDHRVHAPGEVVSLPESIGTEVSLDVDEILKG